MARMETAQGVLEAVATVVGAVGRGAITPSEGQALASLIETQRKAIETVETSSGSRRWNSRWARHDEQAGPPHR